jgi:hypothetical protein
MLPSSSPVGEDKKAFWALEFSWKSEVTWEYVVQPCCGAQLLALQDNLSARLDHWDSKQY